MKATIFKRLQHMKAQQLIMVSVLCSILLTEMIVAIMGLLLKGTVSVDYLLTGLVASCFVATLIVVMFSQFREQLAENTLKLRTIIETQPECVKLLAANGSLLQMNPAGLAMIEADSENQVIGLGVQHIILPEHRNAFGALIKRVFKGKSGNLEFEICGLKGTHRWLETHAVPLRDGNGTITALLSITRDITERKQMEQQLCDSENKLNTILDSVDAYIYIKDTNYRYQYANRLVRELFKQPLNAIIGKTDSDFFDTATTANLRYNDRRVIEDGERLADEEVNVSEDGSLVTAYISVKQPLRSDDGTIYGLCGISTDITERKQAEKHIHNLAFYDPLTQLPNRRLLHERLKHGIEINHRAQHLMAVLLVDLDKFKAINDTLGHSAGDELLQQVAHRIKTCVRDSDTVARLGGDEFVILLENVNHDDIITHIANTIIHSLHQPFTLSKNHKAYIGASIGISLHPQHGDTVETLMDHADAALYHAKDQGRSCFAYFSEDLTRKACERLALESRLRNAIEQHELHVYFQPQIDIVSNQLIGAEALVRWHDPLYGIIIPDVFIGLAEETGLIVPLGEFVLRETCRLGKQWLDAGLPSITLAVNVSPCQFRRCDINALVTQVLFDTGFPAESLELEITESGLMDNQQHAMTILKNLHKQGVKIAIDDFGTGYSSLAYLKYFPLDVLKIDKTFIDDIPFLAGDMAITAAIIAMGHHLGFKVLAEGVETAEQLAFLRVHGCDMYQGYFYSKPLPAADFVQLLSQQA